MVFLGGVYFVVNGLTFRQKRHFSFLRVFMRSNLKSGKEHILVQSFEVILIPTPSMIKYIYNCIQIYLLVFFLSR